MTSTASVCQGTTKDGRPCRAFAVAGSSYCFSHDPDLARERAAARSKGGKARQGRHLGDGDPVEVRSVADVCSLLERTAGDLFALENSLGRARAVCYLASVLLKALELGDIEERLCALEEELGVTSGS